MTHQDHGTGAVVFQIRRFETGFYMVQDHGDCNVHMSALALQFLIGKQYKGGARQWKRGLWAAESTATIVARKKISEKG